MNSYDYIFKLVVVGESGVGKSCLLIRYADDSFSEVFISTIGVDFKLKTINLQSKVVKLQIWDTAGQERFKTITTSYLITSRIRINTKLKCKKEGFDSLRYYRGASGIVLCYDITDRATFTKLSNWSDEVTRYATKGAPILLCGLKSDMEAYRVVSTKEGQEFAAKNNMMFLETSAKKNTKVDDAFEKLAQEILTQQVKFGFHGAKDTKPQLVYGTETPKPGCMC